MLDIQQYWFLFLFFFSIEGINISFFGVRATISCGKLFKALQVCLISAIYKEEIVSIVHELPTLLERFEHKEKIIEFIQQYYPAFSNTFLKPSSTS